MKTNFWPAGVAITLLLFFLGTIGLIVMASTQRIDLVTNNYYEDEIRFQKQIDRVEHTQRLETKATAVYDSATQRLTISLPRSSMSGNVQGQIQLYRPSSADLDRSYSLKPGTDGCQVIDASRLLPGLWRAKVSWNAHGQDFYFDQKIVVQTRD